MSNPTTTQSTLIGGHAEYVKGAVEGAVGAVTNSAAWKDSAEQDKKQGIEDMKSASQNREPPASGGFVGKVEEVVGGVVGCEGMEREGAESKKTSTQ